MKYFSICPKALVFVLLALSPLSFMAQDTWMSYTQKIDVSKHIGQKFKFSGLVRAEIDDEIADAHLWVRVDKAKGFNFMDNMADRPIRSNEWKEYVIEGKIDTGSTNLFFGAWSELNGKFYYDDLKLELETAKGKWTTVFTANFEDNKNPLVDGVEIEKAGEHNPNFTAQIVDTKKTGNTKCLLVTGKNVPNYGCNKEAGKFADVNGIKLYYEIYGQGPPLLIMHGDGGSIAEAANFYPILMKKYKVIAVDTRGQGRSTDTDAPLTYEQMASDMNALLEQLKIDSVFIWGQSDGAILGLMLAMDYPKKVKKVIAFGSNIQPDSSAVFGSILKYFEQSYKTGKDKKQNKLYKLMLDNPNIPLAKLHTIKAPVLIMAGDRDAIRPEHTLKIFQNIPNSQMCIFPGSTHGACWENEEMFLLILNNFFTKPFTMPNTKSWWSVD